MNLIGYWRSEDQIRVGEYERRVLEEKKDFAGKVAKIAKMIARTVAFEGLQPMITEASLKGDNIQCGLDAVKKSKEEWKFWIVMIIVFNIVGFPAVIFVLFKIYKHVEISYFSVVDPNRFKASEEWRRRLKYLKARLVTMMDQNLKRESIFYTTTPG